MKNQYFGDVNDYRKYSLLRELTGSGSVTASVCWALTPDDDGSDGSRIAYLSDPVAWGGYDPAVYRFLRDQVVRRGIREVRALNSAEFLTGIQYFDDVLPDDATGRAEYFDRFFEDSSGSDLVFFDPDNGLSVKSVARGRPGSSKYLYEDELLRAVSRGQSVLVYQHFPRRPRDAYVLDLAQRLGGLGKCDWMFAFRTSHVVFALLPGAPLVGTLLDRALTIRGTWGAMMTVEVYRLRGSKPPWLLPYHVSASLELVAS